MEILNDIQMKQLLTDLGVKYTENDIKYLAEQKGYYEDEYKGKVIYRKTTRGEH